MKKIVGCGFGLALLLAGCDGPPVVPDGSIRLMDSSSQCSADIDCSDDTFCNGAERCVPSSPQADARGCIRGPAVCPAGRRCSELGKLCFTDCALDPDADGDGWGAPECGDIDCDDGDPSIYPGAPEICGDGIDNNCDGVIDVNCVVPDAGVDAGWDAGSDAGQDAGWDAGSDGGRDAGSDGGHAGSDGGHAGSDGGHADSDGGHAASDGGHADSDGGHADSDGGHAASDGGHAGSDGGHADSDGGHAGSDGGHNASDGGHAGSDGGHNASDGGEDGAPDGGPDASGGA